MALFLVVFGPSTSKKVTKIGGFLVKMGAKCSLGGPWDTLGAILPPKGAQGRKIYKKGRSGSPPRGALWLPK